MATRTAMDQRIFKQGLSTEAVSLYLLICSLEDAGERISIRNITGRWNSTDAALMESLAALEEKNILAVVAAGRDNTAYRLIDATDWKTGG